MQLALFLQPALESFYRIHRRVHPPADDKSKYWYLRRWRIQVGLLRGSYSPYFNCSITWAINLWSLMGMAANVSSTTLLRGFLRRGWMGLRPRGKTSRVSLWLFGNLGNGLLETFVLIWAIGLSPFVWMELRF